MPSPLDMIALIEQNHISPSPAFTILPTLIHASVAPAQENGSGSFPRCRFLIVI
jgi:hypothetical protein